MRPKVVIAARVPIWAFNPITRNNRRNCAIIGASDKKLSICSDTLRIVVPSFGAHFREAKFGIRLLK